MKLLRIVLLPLLALLVTACSAGTNSTAAPSSGATRVVVTLTDAPRIEPSTMTVPIGAPADITMTAQ